MANADLANKPCAEPGCDQPRVINRTGYVQCYCAEHRRQHMLQWEATRSEKARKNGKAPGKKGRPKKVKEMTDAQKHVGFDSSPEKANARAESFKVCIIDYTADTMTFVEGTITLRCKTDLVTMIPGAWQAVLEGNAKKGYVNIERGTRPEGAPSHV